MGSSALPLRMLTFFRQDVDLIEEIGPHEGVVALFVVTGNAAVFVHIESDYVAERNFALFVELDEVLVHAEGRAAGGASEHEGVFGRRFCFVDAGCDVIGCPARHFVVIVFDYKSHWNDSWVIVVVD